MMLQPKHLDDVFDGMSQRAFQHAPHAFSFATWISPKIGTLIDGMVGNSLWLAIVSWR